MTFTPAVPDPPELDEILWSGFRKCRVAYDAGANGGQTFSEILKFADEVHAFEPEPQSYTYLEHWFKGHEGIILNNLAVSSQSGTIDLMSVPGKIETGQLVTGGTEGMEWSEDAKNEGTVFSVEAITLDAYARICDAFPGFIKIDVEGHELEVIKGATTILRIDRPELLIEIHSEELGREITDLLDKYDYFPPEITRHPHYEEGSTLWKSHFWIKAFPFDD